MKSLLDLIHPRRRAKSNSSKASSPPSSPKPTTPSHIRKVSDEIKDKMFSPFSKLFGPRTPTPASQDKQPSTPTEESRFKTRPRAPGGPLSSHPVTENDIPIWARKGNKEAKNNATVQKQVDDSDAEGYEADLSDTDGSPRLPKIAKIGRLSLVLRDNTVLQAPDDEDEIKGFEIRKRAASAGGPRTLELSPSRPSNSRKEVGFNRLTRASTYDFGTKPSLYDSQFFTSENGESEHSVPEFPLQIATPTAKPLHPPAIATSPAAPSRVSPLSSQDSDAAQRPFTPLNAEARYRATLLVNQSTQTLSTLQSIYSTQTLSTELNTHYTQTPSPTPYNHPTPTSSSPSSQEPKQESNPDKKFEEKRIVVGISGISGSGKSTLAYLLNEIFNPETKEEKDSGVRPQRIITQDDFFKPKESCPTTTFTIGEGEKEFMERSLRCDDLGLYSVAEPTLEEVRGEWREEIREEMEESDDEGEEEDEESDDEDEEEDEDEDEEEDEEAEGDDEENEDEEESGEQCKYGKTWRVTEVVHETVSHKVTWQVTGPDTDAPGAFDFEALEKAVRHLKEIGEVCSDSERTRRERKLGVVESTGEGIFGSSKKRDARKRSASDAGLENGNASEVTPRPKVQHVDNIPYLHSKYGDLILELRQRAQKFFSNSSQKVRFVFVEGMLLYTDPSSSPSHRTQLQSHFDISLFLPTFIPTAKARRLSSPVYTLVKRPGQMWKTEGYFDGVVTKNYSKEHRWLLDPLEKGGLDAARGMRIGGISVRGIADWKVDEGVRNAVQTIMYEAMSGNI